MKYALIEAGTVTNVIVWDGKAGWAPPSGVQAVAVPDDAPVSLGSRYEDGEFIVPEPPEPPPLSAADARTRREALLAQAALRIAPLEDAIDLDLETPEDIEALTAWKQYRVELSRIEQQASFPDAIEWPVAPT